jgi:CBS domain-containing protein
VNVDTELETILGSVREAMTTPVVLLDERMMAGEAARLLEHAGASGAPVTRNDTVVGIMTLRDLMLRAGVKDARSTGPFHRFEHLLAGIEVGRIMTHEVVTARADQSLVDAVRAMVQSHVNRLPVVDDHGRPVGILTRDDVLRAIASRARRA